jgi:transcriptional regulator with XRE-family HTH domain
VADRAHDFEAVRRHVAANLSNLRQRRGWSQQQAADAAGIDLKHLQKLEYGALNPSLRTLVSVAAAFGLAAGKLLVPTRRPVARRPVGRPRQK